MVEVGGDDELDDSTIKYCNRLGIIWYLEVAASPELQLEYERDLIAARAPGIVPVEMINQWEDVFRKDQLYWYSEPQFSKDEKSAILGFHEVWDAVSDEVCKNLPSSITALIGTSAWRRLNDGAQQALKVFMVRGHMLQEARISPSSEVS